MSDRKLIRVKDIMHDGFVMIDGLKTVEEALHALSAESATALIVEKRNENDEFGIVLLADISKKVLAKDKSPARINVYEIMTKPVIGLSPEMDVRYCARLFDRFGLSLAPVITQQNVIGMVGYRQLVLNGLLGIHA